MFKQNFCASQKQVHNKRCPCSVLREAALDRSGTHVLYWCCEHCSCESFTWTDSYATSVSISPAEVVTLGRLASPPTRGGGGLAHDVNARGSSAGNSKARRARVSLPSDGDTNPRALHFQVHPWFPTHLRTGRGVSNV
ncbi:hypothetical protein MRX96_053288 [Rhipicephalus microplus]